MANTYQIKSGDTLYNLAKQYGTTVQNIQSLNKGLSPSTLKVGQSITFGNAKTPVKTSSAPVKVTASAAKPSYSFMPKDYTQTMTPEQIRQYASQQANQKFSNEKLGYDQNIARYNQQMSQLQNDASIRSNAERLAKDKYADAILGVDANIRNTNTRYDNTVLDLNNNYQDAIKMIKNTASDNRGKNVASASQRGLWNSSILDQMNTMVSQSEVEGVSQASKQHSDNIYKLDNEINTLLTNLNSEKTSLTGRQQSDMVARIDELTKIRNDEKSKLQLQIDQQNQLINQSRNNMTGFQNEMFQNLYKQYGDTFRQDRDFNEDKRRFELEYALKKAELAKKGSGGGGGGGSTYSGTKGKPSATKSTGKSVTVNNTKTLDAKTRDAILKAGKGPLDVNKVLNDTRSKYEAPSKAITGKNPFANKGSYNPFNKPYSWSK